MIKQNYMTLEIAYYNYQFYKNFWNKKRLKFGKYIDDLKKSGWTIL